MRLRKIVQPRLLVVASVMGAAASCRGFLAFPHDAAASPPVSAIKTPDASTSILTKDKRLDQIVSVTSHERTLLSLLTELRRETNVRFVIHGEIESIGRSRYNAKFTNATLRDVMDVLAAPNLLQWEQTSSLTYVLRSRANLNDVFLPHNDFARERAEQGRALVATLARMEPELRDKLQNQDSGWVLLSQLPAEAQAPLLAMLDSRLRESQQNNEKAPFRVGDDFGQARVVVQVQPKREFINYFTQIGMDNRGSMGWSFNDLEDRQRAKAQAAKQSKTSPAIYNTADFVAPVVKPVGEKTVSPQRLFRLNLTTPATVAEAAAALAAQMSTGFIADTQKALPKSATVIIDKLTLREAFKELERIYPETEWEVRAGSDMVVVRAPSNQARNARR